MSKSPQLALIGVKVREIRKAKGYSQEGFAHVAGFERAYYGRIERGEVNAAITTFIRIAKTLGVEVGDLVPPVQTLPD